MKKKKETITVTIPVDEYNQLVKDQKFLRALRACGVDNWIGWDDAIDRYEDTVDRPKRRSK